MGIMGTIIIMEETKAKAARERKDLKEAKQRKEVMFGFHNDIPMVIPTAVILQTVRDQRAARLRKAAILAMIITTETIITMGMIITEMIITIAVAVIIMNQIRVISIPADN